MKIFTPDQNGWYCGHWNDSPLQIKYSAGRPLKNEEAHSHQFAEYYLVLSGRLVLEVKKEMVEAGELEMIMIKAGEPHRIIDKVECKYVIIKEKSFPKNKKLDE